MLFLNVRNKGIILEKITCTFCSKIKIKYMDITFGEFVDIVFDFVFSDHEE